MGGFILFQSMSSGPLMFILFLCLHVSPAQSLLRLASMTVMWFLGWFSQTPSLRSCAAADQMLGEKRALLLYPVNQVRNYALLQVEARGRGRGG